MPLSLRHLPVPIYTNDLLALFHVHVRQITFAALKADANNARLILVEIDVAYGILGLNSRCNIIAAVVTLIVIHITHAE